MRALVLMLLLCANARADEKWVVMPNLYGKSRAEVAQLLENAGFGGGAAPEEKVAMACDSGDADDIELEKIIGKVQCQAPESGERVRSTVPVRYTIYHRPEHAGRILAGQVQRIAGMTPDEARTYLKKLGWTGKLEIADAPPQDEDCGAHKICAYGLGPIFTGDDLTVYMTAHLDIAAPPPDPIANDPDHIHMPKVLDMLRKDAEKKLRAGGVKGAINIPNKDGVDWNTWTVCNQTPSDGQITAPRYDVELGFCKPHPPTAEDKRPKLEGMAVEDAKKKMIAMGYKGPIDIVNIENDIPKNCKPMTVCYIDPFRWYVHLENDHPGHARIMAILPAKISLPD